MTTYIMCMFMHHFLERKLPIATSTPGTQILVSSDILHSKEGGYSEENIFQRQDNEGR